MPVLIRDTYFTILTRFGTRRTAKQGGVMENVRRVTTWRGQCRAAILLVGLTHVFTTTCLAFGAADEPARDVGLIARENSEHGHGPFPFRGPDEGYLIGVRNVEPVNGGGDWVCVKPEHWIFEGAGLRQGDRIPGLIGWEYHGGAPRSSCVSFVRTTDAPVGQPYAAGSEPDPRWRP